MLVFVIIGIVKVIAAVSDEIKVAKIRDAGGLGRPGNPSVLHRRRDEDRRADGQCRPGLKAQFTVALGDNFYSHGVTDVNDQRFQAFHS